MTICDTPGLGDTGGVTIDIANTLGIPIAIEKCASVRPILLLNWKTIQAGGRGEQLRNNVKGLTNFFKNLHNYMDYSSKGKPTILILITGVDQNT